MAQSQLRIAMTGSLARCTDVRPGRQDLVILPELLDGGYALMTRGGGIHAMDDAYYRRFADLSRRWGAAILAGTSRMYNRRDDYTNTAVLYHNGRAVLRYDKIHLFRPGKDHYYFRRGTTIPTVRLPLRGGSVTVGVMICFDLRFPELARTLALDGADVIVVPARWPSVRRDAWQTLLKARAIENQVFVVGCNAAGREGGASFVFDPLGRRVPLKPIEGRTGWQACVLDLRAVADVKRFYDTRDESVLLMNGKRGTRVRQQCECRP